MKNRVPYEINLENDVLSENPPMAFQAFLESMEKTRDLAEDLEE